MAASTTTHTAFVVGGAILGATVLATAGTVLLPVLGLGAIAAAVTPGVGAVVGGWLGHVFTPAA